jgi:hypothetical protein
MHCLVSDVHGSFYTLVRLLNQVAVKHPGARLISLGDEIDRGLHSRAVVEFLMAHRIPALMGNHVDLCLAYSEHTRRGYKARCANYYERDIWLYNGGNDALANWPHYRATEVKGGPVQDGCRIPDEVLNWMAALPPYLILDDVDEKGRKCLASHTGYGLNADTGHWFSALWGRHAHGDGEFPDDGYVRIHGHTQHKVVMATDTAINIDTGAAYTSQGMGTLTAIIWPTKELVQQQFDESATDQRFKVVDGLIVP